MPVRPIRQDSDPLTTQEVEPVIVDMSENFHFYSQYYDLLYLDKDYTSEANYVHNQIQQHLANAKSILDFGSGTGRHGELFAELGYDVLGVDKSPEMVEIANSRVRNSNFTSITGDIGDIKLEDKFDVVVALFHVISYQTDNDQLINVFNNIHHHLHNNGICVFDVWYTPAVNCQVPETRIKRSENEHIKVIRIAEPVIYSDQNVVEVNYHLIITDKRSGESRDIYETHPMRHFSIPEISLLARLTGFTILNVEEFLSGNSPSDDTWGICFVVKKNE